MDEIDIRISKEKYIENLKTVINENNFSIIENNIINKNDPYLSYLFAKEFNKANIEKHLDIVLKSNDYQSMYTFAMEIECDKNRILDRLINHGDAKWIYYLAWAKGINLKKIENALINIGDLQYIYNFGVSFEGSDKEKISKIIIDSKKIEYIEKLGKLGVHIYVRENLIRSIEYENLRKLAKKY